MRKAKPRHRPKPPTWVRDCVMTSWQPDGCWLCGALLVGRAEKWCSTKCSDIFWANHGWTWAKEAAKKKAKAPGLGVWNCARCGMPTVAPEVNHITPCLGAHGRNGCHHHQDNLEVLGHSCHLAVTAEQRAAGLFVKGGGG